MKSETVGRPMEILLVEDSLMHARLAIGALRNGQVQHRMTLILDGLEALEFLRREGKFVHAPRPDLILLDLNLPKRDGLEVLADIKSDFSLQDIPVVVMTASDSSDDMERCRLLDVEAYITKPVDLDKFIAVVRQLRSYWRHDVVLPFLE